MTEYFFMLNDGFWPDVNLRVLMSGSPLEPPVCGRISPKTRGIGCRTDQLRQPSIAAITACIPGDVGLGPVLLCRYHHMRDTAHRASAFRLNISGGIPHRNWPERFR
jgi:hypothetical protein